VETILIQCSLRTSVNFCGEAGARKDAYRQVSVFEAKAEEERTVARLPMPLRAMGCSAAWVDYWAVNLW